MGGGVAQDPAHHGKAIAAPGEADAWLMPVLARQAPQGGAGDIGRIGDDEIVAPSRKRGEEVGLHQADAAAQPMAPDIDAGYRQRRGRGVGRVDAPRGEAACEQDGKAARSGA
jgi:hypothetical protein